jgi:hypothetical protein
MRDYFSPRIAVTASLAVATIVVAATVGQTRLTGERSDPLPAPVAEQIAVEFEYPAPQEEAKEKEREVRAGRWSGWRKVLPKQCVQTNEVSQLHGMRQWFLPRRMTPAQIEAEAPKGWRVWFSAAALDFYTDTDEGLHSIWETGTVALCKSAFGRDVWVVTEIRDERDGCAFDWPVSKLPKGSEQVCVYLIASDTVFDQGTQVLLVKE